MKAFVRMTSIVCGILVLVAVAIPPQSHAEPGTERVLIQYRPGHMESASGALERMGAKVHYRFDELNVVAVSLPSDTRNRIESDSNVLLVEPDPLRYPQDQVIPYGVDSVEALDVWDADRDGVIDPGAPTGEGRMVCVIDSGVHISHEDFAGVNFVGGYPGGWDTDLCGHGTHVAGTIAAANNTTGVVGVTPGEVSLYVVKVFGDNCQWTYSSALFDAALRCRDAGADIISISTGGNTHSAIEEIVFDSLYHDNGILSIASAGNYGIPDYFYPASLDSVVSVAAVDQNNVRAPFSRYNDQVELAAPGVDVLSTYNDGGYLLMSGTSMAAPHVSAAAAVVWSSDTSKTNEDIRLALQQTALDLGAPGRDEEYGFGLIQSYAAYQAFGPTAVEMVRFEAIPSSESIRLEWETMTEVDHLGFNLYRAGAADGPRTQLNSSLIPSQAPGSMQGASYEFVDTTAAAGTAHYYWLEDVDTYGRTALHGPVGAEISVYRVFLPLIRR
jgi:hypothetical protein